MLANCLGVNGPTGGHMMLNVEAFANPSITRERTYSSRMSLGVRANDGMQAPPNEAMNERREGTLTYYHVFVPDRETESVALDGLTERSEQRCHSSDFGRATRYPEVGQHEV